MINDPEHPGLEQEERPSDSTVQAPDIDAVPDPEAGPPPAGYGGAAHEVPAGESLEEDS